MTRTRLHSLLLLSVGLLVMASAGKATTLRVARDGTGDYSILFDAFMAAASGDTISVGTGEYTELQPVDGWLDEMIGLTDTGMSLTVIGDHPDSVIVGPVQPLGDLEADRGPCGFCASRETTLRVEGITFRNMNRGVMSNGDRLITKNCRFVHNGVAVSGSALYETHVADCEFESTVDTGVVVFGGRGSTGVLIEDCTFTNDHYAIDLQTAGNIVRRCRFDGCAVGITFTFGGTGVIESCFMTNELSLELGVGIGGSSGPQMELNNCEIIGGGVSIDISSGSLTGTGNVLHGGAAGTIDLSGDIYVSFHGNHILNAGHDWTVRAGTDYHDPPWEIDLTGNYWGPWVLVSDEQLDEWILDGNDSPNANTLVLYKPYHSYPIAVEKESVGGLKGSYRSPK